ncbi:hypothetical protein Tco_0212587 [Tanacetum coccineum]
MNKLVPVYELTVIGLWKTNKTFDEHLKMEMEIPCSNKIKFITACSFSNDSFEDIMKAQISVIKASATLNIQAFKIKKTNETVIKEWEDRMQRAATTASSLEAEQDSGDVEAQIRFEAASKQSNDPPLSRVNTLGNGEDNKVEIKTERELVRINIDDGNAFWNDIEVKTGISKVNTARHHLVLLGII